MRTQAGLHADNALRQGLEDLHQRQSLDLPSQDHQPGVVEAKQMKCVLADVDADNRNTGR